MTAPTFPSGCRSTGDRDSSDLDPVSDEIVVDFADGEGTPSLASTCYGQAVTDCLRIGEDRHLLVVRPDLRCLLLHQLSEKIRVFHVYRFCGEPEARVLLMTELSIRFRASALNPRRRSCLR